jgi:hypothetical protein
MKRVTRVFGAGHFIVFFLAVLLQLATISKIDISVRYARNNTVYTDIVTNILQSFQKNVEGK